MKLWCLQLLPWLHHTMFYHQDDPEDLHFKKGDIMIVIRKDEDEWWTVKHSDGRTGSIPVPYIEVVSIPFVIMIVDHVSLTWPCPINFNNTNSSYQVYIFNILFIWCALIRIYNIWHLNFDLFQLIFTLVMCEKWIPRKWVIYCWHFSLFGVVLL